MGYEPLRTQLAAFERSKGDAALVFAVAGPEQLDLKAVLGAEGVGVFERSLPLLKQRAILHANVVLLVVDPQGRVLARANEHDPLQRRVLDTEQSPVRVPVEPRMRDHLLGNLRELAPANVVLRLQQVGL